MAEAKKSKAKKQAELVVESVPVDNPPEAKVEIKADESKADITAKAGKRSVKAVKAAEEKQAKEERKVSAKAESDKPKPRRPNLPAAKPKEPEKNTAKL